LSYAPAEKIYQKSIIVSRILNFLGSPIPTSVPFC